MDRPEQLHWGRPQQRPRHHSISPRGCITHKAQCIAWRDCHMIGVATMPTFSCIDNYRGAGICTRTKAPVYALNLQQSTAEHLHTVQKLRTILGVQGCICIYTPKL